MKSTERNVKEKVETVFPMHLLLLQSNSSQVLVLDASRHLSGAAPCGPTQQTIFT